LVFLGCNMGQIIVEKKMHVSWVWLNRPELHNAFNAEVISELTTLFLEMAKDADLRLVVLGGKGASFSAGADLNWMKSMKEASEEENYQDAKKLAGLFEAINNLPVPVLGRIHGAALGGGSGLVSVCDYAIGCEKTLLGFTEVRLGLIPAVISPYVISKIGESQARAWFLSGEKFSADIGLRMGLLHEVTTLDKIDTAVDERVSSFLKAGPVAAREAKNLIRVVKPFNHFHEQTCRLIAKRRVSKEGQEGMSSLLEKKQPNWI
jgi:methylglutaconyl-CoA hydratase